MKTPHETSRLSRRAAALVLLLIPTLARASDDVARFDALLEPLGLMVRGPSSAVPGTAGYRLSATLGLTYGIARVGVHGGLQLGAPEPGPAGEVGLDLAFDLVHLDAEPAHAALFIGTRPLARLGLPQGVQGVFLFRAGLRLLGVELAFSVGPEVTFGAAPTVTWNLQPLSVGVDLPELISVLATP